VSTFEGANPQGSIRGGQGPCGGRKNSTETKENRGLRVRWPLGKGTRRSAQEKKKGIKER